MHGVYITAGNVTMTCVASKVDPQNGAPLAAILPPSIIGFLGLVFLVIFGLLYWRKMIADVATYKQNWHKRRFAPQRA